MPYVQDEIEAHAAVVCTLLLEKGGHFYVCGDGQAMVKDVHAALLTCLQSQLGVTREAAEAKLQGLVAEGRYCREVWN